MVAKLLSTWEVTHVKIEKLVTIVVVSVALAALLCSSTVFAGNNPKSWMEVVVMNRAGQEIPVIMRNSLLNVAGTVQIVNTDPIPVEGEVTVDGTVQVDGEVSVTDIQSPVNVDDSTPLNVNVTNPQSGSVTFDGEVTIDDEEPVNVDVSGWLHTTKTGTVNTTIASTASMVEALNLNTTGYKEVTLIVTTTYPYGYRLAVNFTIQGATFEVDNFASDFDNGYATTYVATYTVKGSGLVVTAYRGDWTDPTGFGFPPSQIPVTVKYYMTT